MRQENQSCKDEKPLISEALNQILNEFCLSGPLGTARFMLKVLQNARQAGTQSVNGRSHTVLIFHCQICSKRLKIGLRIFRGLMSLGFRSKNQKLLLIWVYVKDVLLGFLKIVFF